MGFSGHPQPPFCTTFQHKVAQITIPSLTHLLRLLLDGLTGLKAPPLP
jgi:hypothetical protein